MNSQLFKGSLDIDINNYQDMTDVFLSLTSFQKRRALSYIRSTLPKIDGRIHSKHLTSFLYQMIDQTICKKYRTKTQL